MPLNESVMRKKKREEEAVQKLKEMASSSSGNTTTNIGTTRSDTQSSGSSSLKNIFKNNYRKTTSYTGHYNSSARGDNRGVGPSITTSFRDKYGLKLNNRNDISQFDMDYSRNNAERKLNQVSRGATRQEIGGLISGVGTILQEAEVSARSNNAAKYQGEQTYNLRSRQAAEDRLGSIRPNLKQGIDTTTADRVYDFDPNGLSQRIIRRGDQLIESGANDLEKAKEGTGKLGSLAVDLGSNAIQMAEDAAFKPFSLLTLGLRAGGTSSYEARQLGANADQQFTYGALNGLAEGLSERIFNSVGAFSKVYGKGAFSIADKLESKAAASRIVNDFIKSDLGQAIATNLARLGGQGLEEGIEELVVDFVQPAIEYASGMEVQGFNAKDMAYDFLVGALMGAIPGAGEAFAHVSSKMETSQAMRDGAIHSQDVINKAVATAEMSGESTNASILGRQMQNQVDNGRDINASQVNILQREIDAFDSDTSLSSLNDDLVSRGAEEGTTYETARAVKKLLNEETLSETEAETISSSPQAIELINETTGANIDGSVESIQGLANGEIPSTVGTSSETINSMQNATNPLRNESVASQETIEQNVNNLSKFTRLLNRAEKTVFEGMYSGTESVPEYIEGMTAYRNAGRDGIDIGEINNKYDAILTPQQKEAAYRLGLNEAQEEYDERVYLGSGSERNDGQNTKGSIQELAQGSGRETQVRTIRQVRPRDNQSGKYEFETEQVSAKSLGIQNGTDRAVSIIKGGFTEKQSRAIEIGKEAGLKVNIYYGDYISHMIGDQESPVRGFVRNGEVYVRGDDPNFTADQIMLHEVMHPKLDNQEYRAALIQNIQNKIGLKAWNDFLTAYKDAYEGTNMSEYEITDEMLCDFNGKMNVFDNFGYMFQGNKYAKLKESIKETIDQTSNGNKAPPVRAIKMSDAIDEQSIKKQIKDNLTKLNEMDPVIELNIDAIPKSLDIKRKKIISEYKKFGNHVERQGYGWIELRSNEVGNSLGYLKTDGEYASFFAVPRILKRGIQIGEHDNHKSRGYSTTTFAAPVVINGIRGNIAVVVKETGKNHYKTHRILTTDGKAYEFVENKKEAQTHGVTNDSQRPLNTSSIIKSQKTSNVNNEDFSTVLGDSFTTDSKGNARWTENRIDSLIKDYGASNKDYSQAYAVLMDPRDYLKLTLTDELLEKWIKSASNVPAEYKNMSYREARKAIHDHYIETGEWLHDNVNFPLDISALEEEPLTPYLAISSSNGTMVDNHEGRHRMRALMEAGIKSVPVVIRDYDTKYSKKHLDSMTLSSQDFGYDPINNNAKVTVRDLVPIKESNRTELLEKFGGEGEIKFSTAAKPSKELTSFLNANNLKVLPQPKFSSLVLKDNLGRNLTKGQQDYFKDSLARDESGNLVVVYHTTNKGGFTIFDPRKSDDKRSLFFASNFDVSQTYGKWASNPIDTTEEPWTVDTLKHHLHNHGDFRVMTEKEYKRYQRNPGYHFGLEEYDPMDYEEYKKFNGSLGEYRLWQYQKDVESGKTPKEGLVLVYLNNPGIIYAKGGTIEELVKDAEKKDLKEKKNQKGYYACYLNLKNPLIVDGVGANWNRISLAGVGYEKAKKDVYSGYSNMLNDAYTRIKYIDIRRSCSPSLTKGKYDYRLEVSIIGEKNGESIGGRETFAITDDTLYSKMYADQIQELDFSISPYSDPFDMDRTITRRVNESLYNQLADYINNITGISKDARTRLMKKVWPSGVTQDSSNNFDALPGNNKMPYEVTDFEEGLFDKNGDNLDVGKYITQDTLDTARESNRQKRYSTRELAEIAEKSGYDGVIIRNITDIGGVSELRHGASPYSDIYIAFNSEQVKLTSNENPTSDPDIRYSTALDREYFEAVNTNDKKKLKKLVETAAKEGGYRPSKRFHGSLNASFTIFDKDHSHVGGNSGAGFYFSNSKKDANLNYKSIKGADNQIKIDALSDLIIDYGEWDGIEVETPQQAYKLAKKALNQKPGTYEVYLKYDNPYVRDFRNSTNIYDVIMSDFDESLVDRNDYDSDDDYEEDLLNYRSEHFYEAVDRAVIGAYSDMEDRYEVVDCPSLADVVQAISDRSFEYENLTWDDILEAIYKSGEVTLDVGEMYPDGSHEFARAIVENFGFDAIEDKEAGRKFNQLKGRDMTDVEHTIVFHPNQIKSADLITYDDNGDIIPLSERFNSKVNDIRFSTAIKNNVEQLGANVTPGGSVVKYSRASWSETDKTKLVKALKKAGYGGLEIENWINNLDSISAKILKMDLDYVADRSHSALKDNDEYYNTVDLSTLCAKRRLYQGTYNAIMRRMKNYVLTPEDTIRLRRLMDEMGYEVPCGICYEESRKKNEGIFAERWLNGYEKWKGYKNMDHEDPYIPTLDEVTTTDGRDRLFKEHPEALESYLAYQRTRGSANPKVSLLHTDYRGEILKLSPQRIANLKRIGGLRIQSFSDFEVPHVLDMMQVVMDMAAMKLTSQAYTKVPEFADIFGATGIKINLSLIGMVDPKTGKLVFDDKEGINHKKAFALRRKYSKNVGTILVGANVESILAAWKDPRIDMVIPFHRSGWSTDEFEQLGLGDYKDFQEYQSERYILPDGSTMALDKAAKAGYITKEMAEELYATSTNEALKYWDPTKSGKENAELYLKKCAELHRRPVFYNFLHDNGDGSWSLQEDGSTDGYWKSLVDYKMFDNDGNFAAQEEVKPNFDMKAASKAMKNFTGDTDTLPVASDVVEAFLNEMSEKHDTQFSTVLDKEYMDAVNSGDMDKAQQMVDEAAKRAGFNSPKLYHGTRNGNFNEFKPNESLKESGGDNQIKGYFSEDEEYARVYGSTRSFYVKIENPLDFYDTSWQKPIDEWRKWFASKGVTRIKFDSSVGEDTLKGGNYDGVMHYSVFELFDIGNWWGGDGNLTSRIRAAGYDGMRWDYDEKAWIPFDANKIASADPVTYDDNGDVIPLSKRFDENNNDTRFSSIPPRIVQLQRENEQLKQKVDFYKSQLKRTTRVSLRTNDIKTVAKDLKSSYTSLIDSDDLVKRLKKLGEDLANGHGERGEVDFDRVKVDAIDIARDIVYNASELVNDETQETYKAIKEYFKGVTIKVNASDFADYNDYRKSVLGKLRLSKSSGKTMDQYWSELQNLFGMDLFPDAIVNDDGSESSNPSDLTRYVIKQIEYAEDVYENPFSYDMAEAIDYCSNEIIDRLLDENVRQTPPTFADRMEKAIGKEKAHTAERVAQEKAAKWEALNREKIRNAKRVEEAIKNERKKRDEMIQRMKDHQKQMRDAKRTKKLDSEARTKLLKVARRLDKIKTTDANKSLINSLIGDLDLVAKSMTGNTKIKLEELEKWYQDQVENNEWFVKNEKLEAKFERLRKVSINDITIEDVQTLTDILLMIEHKLRTDTKLINSQYKHDVFMAAIETVNGIENANGLKWFGLHRLDNVFVGQTLSPIRYMRRVVGYDENNPLMIATRELEKGQNISLDYRMKALKPFQRFTDKKFTDYLNGKKAPEITVNATTIDMKPTTVKITPAIRIWFYLSSKNEDNMRHIVNGGVHIPDVKLLKQGERTDAYDKGQLVRFSKSQVQAIINGMTGQEKAYADEVYNYFNVVAPEATNRVSEFLDGISIAKVKNYLRISVDKNFLDVDADIIKRDGTLEGMGSHKERVKSSKPVYAEDITDLLMSAIEADSKYVGLAIPIRNFNKIYHSSSIASAKGEAERRSIEGAVDNTPVPTNGLPDTMKGEETASYRTLTGGYLSVQETIKKLWSSDATDYIDKVISDLQFAHSGAGTVEKTLRRLTSNYAGAVLSLNASVAIKQAASFPTAAAVVGWGPLLKLGRIGKLDLDYVDSITPLLNYRTEGFNFREVGDIQNRPGRDNLFKKALRFKYFNWIQGVDIFVTRQLFKAAQVYVEDTYGLHRGDNGYDERVAEIYNRIITETQPNYTTMQRPGHLRSDSTLERTLSMFKTQPYQNFNIWFDATGNYLAKRTKYMNTKSEEAKSELKEAKINLGRATTSQIVQLAVFAAMTSLWALFRGKDDKYRDEEGKITFGSYFKQLSKDMISGFSAEFFLGSEVFTALDSKINDTYYYGFSSVTDSSINDFFNTSMDMMTLMGQTWDYITSDDKESIDTKEIWKQAGKVAKEGGRFTGVPTGNVMNLYDGIYRWAAITSEGKYIGEYRALESTFAKDSEKMDNLFMAYRNDKTQYDELRKIMVEDGIEEDKIESAMKDRRKKNKTESEQKAYDQSIAYLSSNSVWSDADPSDQERFSKIVEKISVGIEDSDTQSISKKAINGLTEEEVILYRLALKQSDADNNGSYKTSEKEAAIKLLKDLNLSAKEKEILMS